MGILSYLHESKFVLLFAYRQGVMLQASPPLPGAGQEATLLGEDMVPTGAKGKTTPGSFRGFKMSKRGSL